MTIAVDPEVSSVVPGCGHSSGVKDETLDEVVNEIASKLIDEASNSLISSVNNVDVVSKWGDEECDSKCPCPKPSRLTQKLIMPLKVSVVVV